MSSTDKDAERAARKAAEQAEERKAEAAALVELTSPPLTQPEADAVRDAVRSGNAQYVQQARQATDSGSSGARTVLYPLLCVVAPLVTTGLLYGMPDRESALWTAASMALRVGVSVAFAKVALWRWRAGMGRGAPDRFAPAAEQKATDARATKLYDVLWWGGLALALVRRVMWRWQTLSVSGEQLSVFPTDLMNVHLNLLTDGRWWTGLIPAGDGVDPATTPARTWGWVPLWYVWVLLVSLRLFRFPSLLDWRTPRPPTLPVDESLLHPLRVKAAAAAAKAAADAEQAKAAAAAAVAAAATPASAAGAGAGAAAAKPKPLNIRFRDWLKPKVQSIYAKYLEPTPTNKKRVALVVAFLTGLSILGPDMAAAYVALLASDEDCGGAVGPDPATQYGDKANERVDAYGDIRPGDAQLGRAYTAYQRYHVARAIDADREPGFVAPSERGALRHVSALRADASVRHPEGASDAEVAREYDVRNRFDTDRTAPPSVVAAPVRSGVSRVISSAALAALVGLIVVPMLGDTFRTAAGAGGSAAGARAAGAASWLWKWYGLHDFRTAAWDTELLTLLVVLRWSVPYWLYRLRRVHQTGAESAKPAAPLHLLWSVLAGVHPLAGAFALLAMRELDVPSELLEFNRKPNEFRVTASSGATHVRLDWFRTARPRELGGGSRYWRFEIEVTALNPATALDPHTGALRPQYLDDNTATAATKKRVRRVRVAWDGSSMDVAPPAPIFVAPPSDRVLQRVPDTASAEAVDATDTDEEGGVTTTIVTLEPSDVDVSNARPETVVERLTTRLDDNKRSHDDRATTPDSIRGTVTLAGLVPHALYKFRFRACETPADWLHNRFGFAATNARERGSTEAPTGAVEGPAAEPGSWTDYCHVSVPHVQGYAKDDLLRREKEKRAKDGNSNLKWSIKLFGFTLASSDDKKQPQKPSTPEQEAAEKQREALLPRLYPEVFVGAHAAFHNDDINRPYGVVATQPLPAVTDLRWRRAQLMQRALLGDSSNSNEEASEGVLPVVGLTSIIESYLLGPWHFDATSIAHPPLQRFGKNEVPQYRVGYCRHRHVVPTHAHALARHSGTQPVTHHLHRQRQQQAAAEASGKTNAAAAAALAEFHGTNELPGRVWTLSADSAFQALPQARNNAYCYRCNDTSVTIQPPLRPLLGASAAADDEEKFGAPFAAAHADADAKSAPAAAAAAAGAGESKANPLNTRTSSAQHGIRTLTFEVMCGNVFRADDLRDARYAHRFSSTAATDVSLYVVVPPGTSSSGNTGGTVWDDAATKQLLELQREHGSSSKQAEEFVRDRAAAYNTAWEAYTRDPVHNPAPPRLAWPKLSGTHQIQVGALPPGGAEALRKYAWAQRDYARDKQRYDERVTSGQPLGDLKEPGPAPVRPPFVAYSLHGKELGRGLTRLVLKIDPRDWTLRVCTQQQSPDVYTVERDQGDACVNRGFVTKPLFDEAHVLASERTADPAVVLPPGATLVMVVHAHNPHNALTVTLGGAVDDATADDGEGPVAPKLTPPPPVSSATQPPTLSSGTVVDDVRAAATVVGLLGSALRTVL